MALSLIVAINKKGYIGKDGGLMWSDKEDMKRFREMTIGKTLIVGRKTCERLPKLLMREVVCVSRKGFLRPPQAATMMYDSLDQAMKHFPDAWIIGGAEIYRQAMASGRVKYFYITQIDDDQVGDVKFPWGDFAFRFL